MKTHLNLSHTTLTVIKGKYELLSCFLWGSCLLNKRGGYWNIQFLRAKKRVSFFNSEPWKSCGFKKAKRFGTVDTPVSRQAGRLCKDISLFEKCKRAVDRTFQPSPREKRLAFQKKGIPLNRHLISISPFNSWS